MSKLIDLIGEKFGRLVVVKQAKNDKKGNSRWLCRCECKSKKEIIIRGWCLRNSHTKSCGCLAKINALKHGRSRNDRTYKSWCHIIQRCINPNHKYYKDYGDRGIKVCKRWMKFQNFFKDMGERSPGYQIDRIDNNKGYYKENCHWVTSKQNNRNRRDNCLITHDKKTQCLAVWSEEIGIQQNTLWMRIFKYGWSIEKALTMPV